MGRVRLRQGGQALWLGLLMLAVLLATWAGAYLTSRMVATSARLGQVADAVAYSGALMQARQLNLLAYMQRAQLAHQVAMAHLTTLIAWTRLGATQQRQRRLGNPPAFLIGKLFGPRFGLAYGAVSTGQSSGSYSVGGLQASLKRHDSVVHRVLSQVARQQWTAASSLRGTHMAQVLRANYRLPNGRETEVPEMRLYRDTFSELLAWQAPTRPQGLRRLALTVASRYAFLRPRDLTRTNAWMVQWRCPNRRHQLRRRGRTFLDRRGRWGANDTLSFQALRSNRWIGCYLREYPMGWAATGAQGWRAGRDYVSRPLADFSAMDFWRWFQQQSGLLAGAWRNNALANSYAMRDAPPAIGLQGLPDVLGLSEQGERRPQAQLALSLHSAAALSDLGLRSTVFSQWLRGMFPGADALVLTSRAAAETYFSPPTARGDGLLELPSLWQPYWQARLIPLSALPSATSGVQP